MVLHVTIKENVIARKTLILVVTSVINVVLETMGFQAVKVGLTFNNVF